jgi:hypothetical protein
MAYDSVRGVVALFGGHTGFSADGALVDAFLEAGALRSIEKKGG